jgi:hypothetical protein
VTDRQAYTHRQPWFFAVLAAMLVVCCSICGPSVGFAADDAPAAAKNEAAENEADENKSAENEAAEDEAAEGDRAKSGESDADQPEPKDEQSGSSEKQVEEVDSEDAEGEVEVEPDEEEGNEPPADDEDSEVEPPKKEKLVIGATASVLEKQSNLLFRARVDTGAKSCSLHVEDITIENEQEKWVDNIGKVVHFKVKALNGESHYLDARIDGYVIIKTSSSRQRRYKVPLTLRWKGVEKTVLVTLNDRDGMEYPLLLGRNFLRGDFVVDVEVDDDD